MSTDLAEITEPLTDAAAMSDGTVWVACWSAVRPLLKLGAWQRSEVARCNGMVLSRIEGEVTETAAPAEAGVIEGVFALHPDGWAVALDADDYLQLWEYSGSTWVVAARLYAGSGDHDCWVHAASTGNVYLVTNTYTEAYLLAGAALVLQDSEQWPTELREAPALDVFHYALRPVYHGETVHNNGAHPSAARWRGRWYGWGVDDALGTWDGQGYSPLAAIAGNAELVLGGGTRLHLLGYAQGIGGAWYCYGSGAVDNTDTEYRMMSGHHTSGRVWMIGEYRPDAVHLTATHLLRIDRAAALAPAVYEERQAAASVPAIAVYEIRGTAGSDAALAVAIYEARQGAGGNAEADSPEVYELRQSAGALAVIAVLEARQGARQEAPELRAYEVRQTAGSDATATISVYEARQTAGGDAATTSPELYEVRQAADCALSVVRLYEARQWAYTEGGPLGGELVRFIVHDGDDQASAALVDCGPQTGLRILARGEPADGVGAPDVEAWGTYQGVTVGYRTELENPGMRVRVAVIKAEEAAVPEIGVMVRRDGE